MKTKLLSLVLLSLFITTAQAQDRCSEYEQNVITLEEELTQLDIKLESDRSGLAQANAFVKSSLAEVTRTGKPLKMTVTIGAGVVSLTTAILSIRLLRTKSTGGIGGNIGQGLGQMFGGLIGLVAAGTGLYAGSGIYKYYASRSDLEQAKESQDSLQIVLNAQQSRVDRKESSLDSAKKVFYKLCPTEA
jgi:hypothetical protein